MAERRGEVPGNKSTPAGLFPPPWMLVVLPLMVAGCGDHSGRPRGSRAMTRAEAEKAQEGQLRALEALKRKVAESERDRQLSRAVAGRWTLRDVPPNHYRMLDETKFEKVQRPHAEAFLELWPDGLARGTAIGVDRPSAGKWELAVYDGEFVGTWDVHAGRLRTTTRGSHHTSTQIERIEIEGDCLKLTNPEDRSAPPKVFVRAG